MCIEGLLYIQLCESTKVQRSLYILNDYTYFSNYPIQITSLVSQTVSSDLDGNDKCVECMYPPQNQVCVYCMCVYILKLSDWVTVNILSCKIELKSPFLYKFSELLHRVGMNFTIWTWQRKPLPTLSIVSIPLELHQHCTVWFLEYTGWSLMLVLFAHTISCAWKAPFLFLYFSTNYIYLSVRISDVPPSCFSLTRLRAFNLGSHNPELLFNIALRTPCYLFKVCLYY